MCVYLVHIMIAVLLSYLEGIRGNNTVIRGYAALHNATYYPPIVHWLHRLRSKLVRNWEQHETLIFGSQKIRRILSAQSVISLCFSL